MKKAITFLLICVIFLYLQSCITYREIYDTPSRERQRDIQGSRLANAAIDGLLSVSSAFLVATTGIYTGFIPEGNEFRKLVLLNPTPDTMFVNIVTDFSRNKKDFCDFMDIRIPPQAKCRLLLPLGVKYNVYFGITGNPENDEMVGINTAQTRKLVLKPGSTKSDIPETR
jgi:hypothetical protein